MFNQESPIPLTPQVLQQFLSLVDEISAIQERLLDETAFLRARVRELEALGGGAEDAGGRP
jgi:hypothetical protein